MNIEVEIPIIIVKGAGEIKGVYMIVNDGSIIRAVNLATGKLLPPPIVNDEDTYEDILEDAIGLLVGETYEELKVKISINSQAGA